MKRIIASITAVAIACLAVALIPNQQPATAQQFVDLSSMETLSIDLASLEQRVLALEVIQCDCDQARQQTAAPVAAPAAPIVRQSIAEQLGVDHPSLASPSWTYPGRIQPHLASDHGVDASGMSNAEAVALHNRLHNAESRGIPVGAVSYTADDCPNGMCPTDAFDNVSSDCPTGNCPTSAGGVGSAAQVGGRVIDRIREKQPIRSFISRFRRR